MLVIKKLIWTDDDLNMIYSNYKFVKSLNKSTKLQLIQFIVNKELKLIERFCELFNNDNKLDFETYRKTNQDFIYFEFVRNNLEKRLKKQNANKTQEDKT